MFPKNLFFYHEAYPNLYTKQGKKIRNIEHNNGIEEINIAAQISKSTLDVDQ